MDQPGPASSALITPAGPGWPAPPHEQDATDRPFRERYGSGGAGRGHDGGVRDWTAAVACAPGTTP